MGDPDAGTPVRPLAGGPELPRAVVAPLATGQEAGPPCVGGRASCPVVAGGTSLDILRQILPPGSPPALVFGAGSAGSGRSLVLRGSGPHGSPPRPENFGRCGDGPETSVDRAGEPPWGAGVRASG